MLRTIIIEDEVNNRELLYQMVTEYLVGIDVVDLAHDVNSAILSIEKYDPDLIFLDIEMPGGTGFDIIKHFSDPKFKVIFVTGYEDYALNAIKHSAIDYILKPIDISELKKAVSKIKTMEMTQAANVEFIKTHIHSGNEELAHLLISDYNTSDTLLIKDIIYLESQDKYTLFHLKGNRMRVSSLSLSFFESLLNPSIFCRIHRSVVVNCGEVRQISEGRAIVSTMSNGHELNVAYRRKIGFLSQMEKVK